MNKKNFKIKKRGLRHHRVRAKIAGTKSRPRVSVFRSNQHVFVQVINDKKAETLLSFGDFQLAKDKIKGKTKTEVSSLVGKELGEQAKKAGIESVVFDRGGFSYHGRVKAIADGLRDAGLSL